MFVGGGGGDGVHGPLMGRATSVAFIVSVIPDNHHVMPQPVMKMPPKYDRFGF